MQKEPIPIQLAIQGGGAKIAALMAALEQIDELQHGSRKEPPLVKVTRISGTSAGAIVGAIFASGYGKIKQAREQVAALKPKDIRKMFPAPWPPTKPHLLAKLWAGKPIWKIDPIEKLLIDMLKEEDRPFETLADLAAIPGRNIILKIIASNLSESKKVVFQEKDSQEIEKAERISLIPSLLDSCGLPYCFRMWSKDHSPVIVDGGICDNLPSGELDSPADVLKYGPVIGISFEPPCPRSVDSALSFSSALLDTSMQNSMERARQRLGDGNILQIETDLTTFDLAGAVEWGLALKGAYGNVMKQTQIWFTDFAERTRIAAAAGSKVLIGDPWANQGIALMDKLGEVYQLHHSNRHAKYTFCSVIVQAKCLATEGALDYGEPDTVRYHGEFEVPADTIFCQRLNVSDTVHHSALNRTKWNLTDLSRKRSIKSIDLPMRTIGSSADKARELLLFWDPPLDPGTGPYRLEFEDQISGFMTPLSQGKDDDLFCLLRQAQGVVDRIDLVLFVPESSRDVILSERDGVAGRELTASELYQYDVPAGYRPFGWTGSNIPAGTTFGVNLRLA